MERYFYLLYSLVFLILLAIILWRRADLRKPTRPALFFGAIAGPVSELIYFQDYWRPPTLLGKGRISIEDIIFGLSIFGLAFVLYPAVARKTIIAKSSSNRDFYRRFSLLLGAGLVLVVVFLGVFHMNSVLATALVFLILWAVMSWYRPDLAVPGLIVGGLLTCFAGAVYYVLLRLGPPHYLQNSWLLFDKPLGITILGVVPVTELIWFFAVGCFLSIFDLFTGSKRYQPLDQESGGRPNKRASHSSTAGTPDNA